MDTAQEQSEPFLTIMQNLIDGTFLGSTDEEFSEFVSRMPEKHWSKNDLSAVRLGWEAHKQLSRSD